MSCACILVADETTVERPCELHARWAKTRAAQTWGDAEVLAVWNGGVKDYARQRQGKGPRANVKTPWEAPR